LFEYLKVWEGSWQHKIAEISTGHQRNWIDDITGFLTPLKVTISWRNLNCGDESTSYRNIDNPDLKKLLISV
jgi:hypothetical protein